MNNLHSKYCFYCEKAFGKFPDGSVRIKTRDHIIPKKEGGLNKKENYVYCCKKCNEMKGHRMPEIFAADLRHMISEPGNRLGMQKVLVKMLENVERLVLQIAPYRHTLQKKVTPKKEGNPKPIKQRIKEEGVTERRPSTPLWWRGLNEK